MKEFQFEDYVDSRVMMEYGLIKSIETLIDNNHPSSDFSRVLKLIDKLDQQSLASLAIYLEVHMKDAA